jgi:hypothetical protein
MFYETLREDLDGNFIFGLRGKIMRPIASIHTIYLRDIGRLYEGGHHRQVRTGL